MRKLLIIIAGIALLTAGFFVGRRVGSGRDLGQVGKVLGLKFVPADFATNNKVGRLVDLIRTQYVDSVSLDSIMEVVMPEIVGVLDPHSMYIPAKDFDRVNESLEGGFGGVGIKFTMLNDTLVVTNVVAGGPSDKAGLENGDRIMRIDTTWVAGVEYDQEKVVGMLRGRMGTSVRLDVRRGERAFEVDVERGRVAVPSVTAAFMVEPGVAYIKLEQFSRTTHEEVQTALTLLQRRGAKSVVLDLRGNSGGFLDQAIALANEFLPEDRMIVYTENRRRERKAMHSDGSGRFKDVPMAVVVDQNSASSSEILAGAMQDNDRAIIVGRRTFGKGLVQEQIPFFDGSAVRLTVARYFTPTGRSIQKPYGGDAHEYALEAYSRSGEYFSVDSVKFADSLKFTTPAGRTVYGGGGIMPDVFVPVDTTYMNNYFMGAQMMALPYRFALRWADRNREEVNAVKSVAGLDKLLDGYQALWSEFERFAAREGLRGTNEEKNIARNVLIGLVRANIGRLTALDDVGFYSEYYVEDQTLKIAVENLL